MTAALFLVLYGTFLGTEGRGYQWMRRYGVVVYFGLTCIAMLCFAANSLLCRLALAPDLICTFYCHEGALAGFVASFLLGLPRVHFHYPADGTASPAARLLPRLLLAAAHERAYPVRVSPQPGARAPCLRAST